MSAMEIREAREGLEALARRAGPGAKACVERCLPWLRLAEADAAATAAGAELAELEAHLRHKEACQRVEREFLAVKSSE